MLEVKGYVVSGYELAADGNYDGLSINLTGFNLSGFF
jgi:hypothetical protein